MARGKGTGERYDWQAIRTEYITSRISLKDLANKHGIRLATVTERSRTEGWVDLRKLYIDKAIRKTIDKESTKMANRLSKELAVADKISDVLTKALEDAEKTFDKYDMKAIQQAASALKMVEEMKRSMLNIQTMSELNRQKNEERKLAMEERKLKLEEEKRGMEKPDSEMTIHIKGYEEGWCD